MLDSIFAQNTAKIDLFPTVETVSKPQTKKSISVVGLGYVGAVSCACLATLGYRVVGVDIDPAKTEAIAAGRSPIHERDLERLLKDGVDEGLISATSGLTDAVLETDITFVSVGTPTAADGGCDTRYIEIAAEDIGRAIARKDTFHVVVMRCSIPPGATMDVMVPIIERVSGKTAGRDFGVAFNPEFLREGVAIDDFYNPPKTVIGASDPKTARIVSSIFTPVDENPIITTIRTAEMVKYVDNVWHATKVCFANEIGRLSKSLDVDGQDVMDIFVQDEKLNLSAYYLKPGFAYGGSCLPKEVRAMTHLADTKGLDLPLIDSLQNSNSAHIEEAIEMARATGAKRIGVLGLAFKPGTDDLRESPILDVMSALSSEGVELLAHDAAITPETQIAAQLSYVAHAAPGLAQLAEGLKDMLVPSVDALLDDVDAVIVTHARPEYRKALAERSDVAVVDVVRLFKDAPERESYNGIGW